MSVYSNEILSRAANNMRVLVAAMVEEAQSGHPGGAMGGASFINLLYSEFLRFDPDNPCWENRDRFFLDPGHMSTMLYSQLAFIGHYSIAELQQFRQWASATPGHPELDRARGIENTSGPLGQGQAFAVGAAIAEKFLTQRFGDWCQHHIYAYISDGGVQEEISQGAGRIAGHLGLNNLIMFFDANDVQLASPVAEVTSEDTAAKYRSWGWRVLEIDGTSLDQMRAALQQARDEKEKPTLLLAKTIMGEGARDSQNQIFNGGHNIHGKPLSKGGADFAATVTALGGDPSQPFQIYTDVAEHYNRVIADKRQEVALIKERQQDWQQSNPAAARRWQQFFAGMNVDLGLEQLASKEDAATRETSAEVLAHLAGQLDNFIVASADLADSDKTDGFLKNSKILRRGDFSGAFLQAGVSELTMAAICSGITLHGGVYAACGTFFVFSDYMKPVVRTAALMELPVKYIWTHDSFRVGEDGPTHQPVEHEAQFRLLEQLQNHHGRNGLLLLRPADNYEALVCWQMALENEDTPTGLIFSRQNIKTLPPGGGQRREQARQARYGAYIVVDDAPEPDLILVASGSEVATLVATAELLRRQRQLKVRVVSAPSEGLFRRQDESYQQQVLPDNVAKFGLTSGLPSTLQGLVGARGKVCGLSSFGFSAPAAVLNDKLGYNPEQVCEKIVEFLDQYRHNR